ncbi:MAG: M23 family metallopeptidase [Pseudonocardiaceae bacterium]
MLICGVLVAVLAGGPVVVTSSGARPVHAIPTGLVVLAGPGDELGQPPRRQFGWPLSGSPTVVRAFRPPEFQFGPGHRGVDLAAETGAPVLAAGAGTVVFAGMVAGRGVVSLGHPGGLRTTYEPVSPTVAAGDQVSRGEQIGTTAPGHAGCPLTVCLHWGAFRGPARGEASPTDQGREYLDPLRLIVAARVRLLPIEDLPDHP